MFLFGSCLMIVSHEAWNSEYRQVNVFDLVQVYISIQSSGKPIEHLLVDDQFEFRHATSKVMKSSVTWLFPNVTGHDLYIKKSINFHPSISIKANGISSHYSEQSQTVTSSYKYAAPKKDEKANTFWSNYFKVYTRTFI